MAFRSRCLFALALEEANVRTLHVSAFLVSVGLFLHSTSALAQSKFATSSAGGNDWSSPAKSKNYQLDANKRHLGIGLSMSGFIVGGRWEIANGGVAAMDVVWRRAFNNQKQNRIELGGLVRFAFTPDALLIGGGVPFRVVMKAHERLELGLGVELSYTRISFNLPFFPARNGFTGSTRFELGYLIDPAVSIGITPIAFSVIAGERVDSFVTYEPGVWMRFSPF